MPLPIGFQRKEVQMRTSILILCLYCLSACNLLKTSTGSKEKVESQSKETLKTQTATIERKSALQTHNFWLNDSSETLSMVEILPSSSIRIYTKRKSGTSQVKKLLSSEEVNSDQQTITNSTINSKVSTIQKSKMTKAPIFSSLAIAILTALLLFALFRYRKILKSFIWS